MAVAQQRCQRSCHCRLRITAGHHDDEIGTVDGRSQIACCALDGGEPGPLALDIDAAKGSDVGKPRIVDVVEPQFVTGDPQLSGEVNSTDTGAYDRERLDRISAYHDCFPTLC